MKQTKKIKMRIIEKACYGMYIRDVREQVLKKVFEILDRAFGIKHQ